MVKLREIIMLVVPDDSMTSSVILGRDVLNPFGLGLQEVELEEMMNIDVSPPNDPSERMDINPNIPISNQEKLKRIFREKYLNALQPEKPQIRAEIKLSVTTDEPIYSQARQLSYAEKHKLREILDKWQEKGVIREGTSQYASSILLVKKRNGELRLCVDYCCINKVTERTNYSISLIEEQLDGLNGKRYFSILGLKDGFHHIDVEEKSVKYTAFITPFGQLEFVKMPFGLKGGPVTFQQWIHRVLNELIRKGQVIVYLDDFLIATKTLRGQIEISQALLPVLIDNKV